MPISAPSWQQMSLLRFFFYTANISNKVGISATIKARKINREGDRPTDRKKERKTERER